MSKHTYTEVAHVEALVAILWGIYDLDEIGKLGGSNTASWIADDIAYVHVKFLDKDPNDSDRAKEYSKEKPKHISYKEAVELLRVRIQNSLPMIVY